MADWVFQNCTDYASWNRAVGAEENRQLKQLVTDLSQDKQMLQDVLKKKFDRAAGAGQFSEENWPQV